MEPETIVGILEGVYLMFVEKCIKRSPTIVTSVGWCMWVRERVVPQGKRQEYRGKIVRLCP